MATCACAWPRRPIGERPDRGRRVPPGMAARRPPPEPASAAAGKGRGGPSASRRRRSASSSTPTASARGSRWPRATSSGTSRCSASGTTFAPRAAGTVRHLVAETGEAVEYGQVVLELQTVGGRPMTLALLFSPQGSQSVGMGRELAERSPAAARGIRRGRCHPRLVRVRRVLERPAERLDDTRQTQPCLLTTSVAAFRALVEAARSRPGGRRGPLGRRVRRPRRGRACSSFRPPCDSSRGAPS